MRNRFKKHFLLLLVLIQAIFLISGCKEDKAVKQAENLPFSDKVVTGKLDNGLTYYIRKNDFPTDKIELRLNVRSGSLDETDSERGLAHFVEHMAFNGTKNFPGNDVIKYMEEVGLTFGRDTNAATSTDYTNYQLTIPHDKDELINKGFLILRDWAGNITFDEAEVEAEKGVIIEEWRSRNNARYRLSVESRKYVADGSLYPERDPIGLVDTIKNATRDQLLDYYNKWYTPENMAVIVVGNIDEKKAEKLIKDTFSDMESKKSPEHTSKNINYPKGTRVAIISDKEAQGVSATLYIYGKGKRAETYEELKEEVVNRGALSLLTRRASLDINEKKLDLLGLNARYLIMGDNAGVVMVNMPVDPKKFNKSLENMLIEIERASRYGFSLDEYKFFKTTQLSFLDTASKPDYKFPSAKYAEQISAYDTMGGSFTEFSQDKALYERIFNDSNVTTFNRAFKELFDNEDRLLIITMPDREKANINITKEDLEKLYEKVKAMDISSHEDSSFTGKLIDEDIKEGKVVSRRNIENIGATEVVYENGAKLIIYKNTEEKDKFLIAGKKLGGLSILSDKEILLSSILAQTMQKSGFEKISKRNLDTLLAGKQAGIAPSITEYTFDFTGGGVVKDMDTMFQVLYKYMTAPNIDEAVLNATINSLKTKLDNEEKDNQIQFGRRATEKMYNDNYRRAYLVKEDLPLITKDALLKLYKDNYLDINNYTFAISGDVDIEKTISLGAKYIGSLKKVEKTAEYKDRDVYLREKFNKYEENGDAIDKTTLTILYMNRPEKDILGKYKMGIVRNALSIRLREAIREDLSGAYSVSAMIRYSETPKPEVVGRISFPLEPARLDEVLKGTLSVFNNYIDKGLTEEELKSSSQAIRNNFKSALLENRYWVNTLTYNTLMKEDILSLSEIESIYDKLTLEDMNKFIKSALKDNDMFISIYKPEGK